MSYVLRRHAESSFESRQLEGLGFSLKPPKWLRKAQPGKILAKVAVPAAAITAAALIPGVAPLALTVAKGALVKGGKLFGSAARAAGGVVRNVLAPPPAPAPTTPPFVELPTPTIPGARRNWLGPAPARSIADRLLEQLRIPTTPAVSTTRPETPASEDPAAARERFRAQRMQRRGLPASSGAPSEATPATPAPSYAAAASAPSAPAQSLETPGSSGAAAAPAISPMMLGLAAAGVVAALALSKRR